MHSTTAIHASVHMLNFAGSQAALGQGRGALAVLVVLYLLHVDCTGAGGDYRGERETQTVTITRQDSIP